MRPYRFFALLLGLTLSGTLAAAEPGLGQLHHFKQWVVGCDNTRRCEAQGYGAEGDSAPAGGRAALIVRREAGPGQNPQLHVAFSNFDERDGRRIALAGRPILLQVGALRVALPPLERDQSAVAVPASQVPAVIAAVLRGDQLSLTIARAQWWVSLAGAHAALLKMDDLQGRVGTSGALVRRGASAEPKAPPIPDVRPLRLPPTTEADRRLAPQLRAALPRNDPDCPDADPAQTPEAPIRLTTTSLLVVQPCRQAAYQASSRLWQVDDRPPFRARSLTLPLPDGTRGDTLILELVSGGDTLALHESAKSRGIGDCWVSREWVWTAGGLALVAAHESPCQLFEAGGLAIELWRTQLR